MRAMGMRRSLVVRLFLLEGFALGVCAAVAGASLGGAIVLHLARGCIWLTRRVLWALMHAGHAISCFMLRQMEYDADSYEGKLAGSDTLEATMTRLQVLSVATRFAYEDVRHSWAGKRLPEDLAALIQHKTTSIPPEVHRKIEEHIAQGKTKAFDTHPCDADRIKAAR